MRPRQRRRPERHRESIAEPLATTGTDPISREEQLIDQRTPTQFGRALAELGITSIAAQSPQAKGRIERAWGTCQDRLVVELRLAGATDLASANRVLARFVARFNRQSPCRRRTPSRPGDRCRPMSASTPCAASSTAGSSPVTTPSGPGRRSSSCRPARAAGQTPGDGSSSSSGSTAGWSSGTANGRSSSSQLRRTRSSSGPFIRLEPSWVPRPRASARWPFRLPPIPGATSSVERSSTNGLRRRDSQDHGSGELTESLICDMQRLGPVPNVARIDRARRQTGDTKRPPAGSARGCELPASGANWWS